MTSEAVLADEALFRLGAFAAVFAIMAILEIFAPGHTLSEPRRRRWTRNLALVALNSALLRFAVPVLAVGAAVAAEARGIGLFNLVSVPPLAAIIASIIVLDLTLYWQHRLFHAVPVLWRLHRTHHIDRDLDLTTGLRFHPFEIVVSMAIKIAVVVALGAPAVAVVLFEIVLNAASLFNHGNLRLPAGLDRSLRRVVVTPAMHWVHHSEDPVDHNRNFGFALSLWDRVFGTYRATAGAADFRFGLRHRRTPRDTGLAALLVDPFRPEERPRS